MTDQEKREIIEELLLEISARDNTCEKHDLFREVREKWFYGSSAMYPNSRLWDDVRKTVLHIFKRTKITSLNKMSRHKALEYAEKISAVIYECAKDWEETKNA